MSSFRRMQVAMLAVFALAVPSALSAQASWRLTEDLRIGGEEPMTIFSSIKGIVPGPDGSIFVLEASAQEIRMFDASGKFKKLVARRGNGPGEIADANGLLLVDRIIWANDPGSSRWSAYSAVDGSYVRQISIPITSYGYLWQASSDAQSRILDETLVATGRVDPATQRPIREPRIRRVSTSGGKTDTVIPPMCSPTNIPKKTSFSGRDGPNNRYIGIPFLATPVAVIDRSGESFWCSPNDEYSVVRISMSRPDTIARMRAQYRRVPVPAALRDEQIASVKERLAPYPVVDADYSLIPTVYPVFERFEVDDKNQLWARRHPENATQTVIDVFDVNARKVATVTSAMKFRTNFPLVIRGDFVYGVVNDADNVPFVVRARIVRGGG